MEDKWLESFYKETNKLKYFGHLKRNDLGIIILTGKAKEKGHMGCFDISQTEVGRLAL